MTKVLILTNSYEFAKQTIIKSPVIRGIAANKKHDIVVVREATQLRGLEIGPGWVITFSEDWWQNPNCELILKELYARIRP